MDHLLSAARQKLLRAQDLDQVCSSDKETPEWRSPGKLMSTETPEIDVGPSDDTTTAMPKSPTCEELLGILAKLDEWNEKPFPEMPASGVAEAVPETEDCEETELAPSPLRLEERPIHIDESSIESSLALAQDMQQVLDDLNAWKEKRRLEAIAPPPETVVPKEEDRDWSDFERSREDYEKDLAQTTTEALASAKQAQERISRLLEEQRNRSQAREPLVILEPTEAYLSVQAARAEMDNLQSQLAMLKDHYQDSGFLPLDDDDIDGLDNLSPQDDNLDVLSVIDDDNTTVANAVADIQAHLQEGGDNTSSDDDSSTLFSAPPGEETTTRLPAGTKRDDPHGGSSDDDEKADEE